MKPSSCKAKGRRLQQDVCDALVKATGGILEPDDVRSTSMGAPGEDVLLSPAARRIYPFSIECKNVEKLNIWQAIAQAKSQGGHAPMVCFKKNNEEIYVAITLKDFLEIRSSGLNSCSGNLQTNTKTD